MEEEKELTPTLQVHETVVYGRASEDGVLDPIPLHGTYPTHLLPHFAFAVIRRIVRERNNTAMAYNGNG